MDELAEKMLNLMMECAEFLDEEALANFSIRFETEYGEGYDAFIQLKGDELIVSCDAPIGFLSPDCGDEDVYAQFIEDYDDLISAADEAVLMFATEVAENFNKKLVNKM